MRVREPIVADQFYPADARTCRREVEHYLTDDAPAPPGRPIGGLVPHAGWMCSGNVAGRVCNVLRQGGSPQTLVLLGGVHRYRGRDAALFASGRWDTPLGPARIDERFCERLLGMSSGIVDDPFAHEDEHSLEVQLPFLVHLFPGVPIVPLMVPISPRACEVGRAVARTVKAYNVSALILGTTDLTHYGPSYGFAPQGADAAALAWAKANDEPFLERLCALRADELVTEAVAHHNACNPGAAAATAACCASLGAARGVLLEHTTSDEVLGSASPNCVGYAGVVFIDAAVDAGDGESQAGAGEPAGA